MHHSDHASFHVDRHSQHRADALLAQDRVDDIGLAEVLDHDRAAAGGDAPREPARQWHLHALAHLLLEAARGARDQHPAVLVEQEDRRRVRVQTVANTPQQLGEHLLEREVVERIIGHAQHLLELA